MNLLSRRRGRKPGALAAMADLLAAVIVVLVVVIRQPATVTARNARIPVTDGPGNDQHVVLDATFFTPPGGGRLPATLLAHGFGETKDAVRPEAEQLARAGFAVLTWSARGFGRSTGQVALDSPSYEVKDVGHLVSWLARQPRVKLDGPGDPRVGITGSSYGGAIALLAAAGHDGGNQETSRITQLTTDWFQRWLTPRQRWSPADPAAATGQPAFAVTRDLGYDPSSGNDVLGVATAPRYPGLAGTRHTAVRLRGPAQSHRYQPRPAVPRHAAGAAGPERGRPEHGGPDHGRPGRRPARCTGPQLPRSPRLR